MPLLVRNGRIITATDDYRADIYAEGETISRIAPSIADADIAPGTEVIDAAGKYVFPGFIDPHVHIHLPFMGTNAKDDHASATKAALAGGTTTVIEMVCPSPTQEPMDAFNEWHNLAEPIACSDFTFHQAVVRFDDLAKSQLRELVANHGVASFKIFLAYMGAFDISDDNLFALLSMAKELGVITTAHCENAVAIDAMQKTLIDAGKTGPGFHEPSRPRQVEAEGVHHLCTFAELTGAHVYTVHTSCAAAVQRAVEARLRGVNVWIEAVAPHLVLDKTYAERSDFEGARYVMSPPLRDKCEQGALWNALHGGDVSTIGTDHAPFDFKGQKDMGKDAFTLIPNGIPSIQERIDLVHTFGVCEGRIDLKTMVSACSTRTAQIFGMYPKKGAIAVGSDADLVIYDPKFSGTFSHADSLSQVDYCGFEGMTRKGRADTVTLRGEIAAKQGKFVGTEGRGAYIKRAPTHF